MADRSDKKAPAIHSRRSLQVSDVILSAPAFVDFQIGTL
jgi:hypothetical protein